MDFNYKIISFFKRLLLVSELILDRNVIYLGLSGNGKPRWRRSDLTSYLSRNWSQTTSGVKTGIRSI